MSYISDLGVYQPGYSNLDDGFPMVGEGPTA